MLPLIEQLLVLQDRDRLLHRLQAEIDAVPGQRKLLQERAAKAQADLDGTRNRCRQIESDRKRLELEVDSLKQRIAKVQAEQNNTRSNEQYKTFQHQIDTTAAEIARLDDQQLELMEQGEVAAREAEVAGREASARKAESDRALADLAAREANLNRERAGVTAERARLAAALEPAALQRYERLLKTKGDNVVVGVHHGVCGGCHMRMPTQSFLHAMAAVEIASCPNCARLLYHTADMAPAERDDV
ncbi:MAG: zinc ribbon domain-containing protein [Verrucomicrobiota bacterium]